MTEKQFFFHFLARAGKEGGVILIAGLCLFLSLALLTYETLDPGWSHLGYGGSVKNAAGIAGAWTADFLISLLGYLAYPLPIALIYRMGMFFRRGPDSLFNAAPLVALRLFGAVLLVSAGTALCGLHFSNESMQLPFASGGILGATLSVWVVGLFGLHGGTLALLTVFLFGFSLFTDLSWLRLSDQMGGVIFNGWSRLQNQFATEADAGGEASVDEAYDPRVESFNRTDEEVSPPTGSMIQTFGNLIKKVGPQDKPSQQHGLEQPSSGDPQNQPRSRLEPQFDSTVELLPDELEPFSGEHELELISDEAELIPDEAELISDEAELFGDELELLPDDALTMEPVVSSSRSAEMVEEATSGTELPESDPAINRDADSERALKIVPLAEVHKTDLGEKSEVNIAVSEPRTPDRKIVSRPLSVLPHLSVLDPPEVKGNTGYSPEQLESMSRLLETKLKDFGVVAEVVEVNPGPVITRFEIQPAPGVKVSKITNLSKDLARSMTVRSVRVVEVIAGKSVVGIEIPNEAREVVRLSEVLGSDVYIKAESKLSLGLGNDIAGHPVVVNLAKMPHLLVAGTTGSGKSVGVNAMLLSLLLKATPDEVRLMMVDPKMLELSIYEGIPHLLTPVITDMKEAAGGLRWCVAEMERRYRLMSKLGVRNLAGYNDKVTQAEAAGKPILDPLWNPEEQGEAPGTPAPALTSLPFIVVVIDEFADMMMIVGKKVEELIARIAQKARAAGIHLILATQRPSVDVITGLIKANIPTRIAFQVSSKIDSRTILDQSGAENLLGYGDMLYLPAGTSMPVRVHGAFVADDEVHRVVEEWKKRGSPDYIEEILMGSVDADLTQGAGSLFGDEDEDELYDEAVAFVTQSRRASISSVQRKLKIGYNRAARLVEAMEGAGIVSESGHNGSREVLAPPPV